jgi:hypothetical protein
LYSQIYLPVAGMHSLFSPAVIDTNTLVDRILDVREQDHRDVAQLHQTRAQTKSKKQTSNGFALTWEFILMPDVAG